MTLPPPIVTVSWDELTFFLEKFQNAALALRDKKLNISNLHTYHSDSFLRFSAERFDCRNSSALALLVHVGLAASDISEAGQRRLIIETMI